MGLLDAVAGAVINPVVGFFQGVSSSGAGVASSVLSRQPVTSSGTPYVTPQVITSQSNQPSTPINPVGTLSGITTTASNIASPIFSGISDLESKGSSLLSQALPTVKAAPAALSFFSPATIAPAIGIGMGLGAASLLGNMFAPASSGVKSSGLDIGNPAIRSGNVSGLDIGSPLIRATTASPALADELSVFVPYGNRAQTEIQNAKIAVDPLSGELGIYQKPYGHSIYNLVGGGGPAALQSGMFTVNKPETPVVFTQESGGSRFAPSADILGAASVLSSPSSFSRLGSEVYGGYVQPLSGKTVESTGAQLSTYKNPYNLANLVSPTGVNLPKSEQDLAAMPWSIPASTPAISRVGAKGIEGELLPGKSSILDAASSLTGLGLPSPFKSTISGAGEQVAAAKGTIIPSVLDLALMNADIPFLGRASPVAKTAINTSDFWLSGTNPIAGAAKTITGAIGLGDIFSRYTETTTQNKGAPTSVVTPIEGGTLTTTTTPSATTVTRTPIEGGFEQWDIGAGKAFGMKPPSSAEETGKIIQSPVTQALMPAGTGILASVISKAPGIGDYFNSYVYGGAKEVAAKPLTAVMNYGVGIGLAGLGEGVLGLGEATEAATADTILAPVARGLNLFASEYAPKILTGLYAADVAGRSTAWGTDISSKAAERFGGITSTELGPMVLGGITYGNRGGILNAARDVTGFAARSVVRAPGEIVGTAGDFLYGIRQRAAGIENIGVGGGKGFDVFSEEGFRSPASAAKTGMPARGSILAGGVEPKLLSEGSLRLTRSEAMEKIQQRYPEQGAIWEKHMTDIHRRGGEVGAFLDRAPTGWFKPAGEAARIKAISEIPYTATDADRYATLESMMNQPSTPLLEGTKALIIPKNMFAYRTTETEAAFSPVGTRITQKSPTGEVSTARFKPGAELPVSFEAWTGQQRATIKSRSTTSTKIDPYTGETTVIGSRRITRVPERAGGVPEYEEGIRRFNIYDLPTGIATTGTPVRVSPEGITALEFSKGGLRAGVAREYEMPTSGKIYNGMNINGDELIVSRRTTEARRAINDFLTTKKPEEGLIGSGYARIPKPRKPIARPAVAQAPINPIGQMVADIDVMKSTGMPSARPIRETPPVYEGGKITMKPMKMSMKERTSDFFESLAREFAPPKKYQPAEAMAAAKKAHTATIAKNKAAEAATRARFDAMQRVVPSEKETGTIYDTTESARYSRAMMSVYRAEGERTRVSRESPVSYVAPAGRSSFNQNLDREIGVTGINKPGRVSRERTRNIIDEQSIVSFRQGQRGTTAEQRGSGIDVFRDMDKVSRQKERTETGTETGIDVFRDMNKVSRQKERTETGIDRLDRIWQFPKVTQEERGETRTTSRTESRVTTTTKPYTDITTTVTPIIIPPIITRIPGGQMPGGGSAAQAPRTRKNPFREIIPLNWQL